MLVYSIMITLISIVLGVWIYIIRRRDEDSTSEVHFYDEEYNDYIGGLVVEPGSVIECDLLIDELTGQVHFKARLVDEV